MSHSATSAAPHAEAHHMPFWVLVVTLLALLALTFLTVSSVWWIDLGHVGNLWMAMIIATIKGTLVALYFMHLRYEKPIMAVILIAALLFVLLFIGAALNDSLEYQPGIQEFRDADPSMNYAPALQGAAPAQQGTTPAQQGGAAPAPHGAAPQGAAPAPQGTAPASQGTAPPSHEAAPAPQSAATAPATHP